MEETNNELQVGDIVTGTVVKIDEKQVFVDVGQKSEGIIQLVNFLIYMLKIQLILLKMDKNLH